MPQLPTKDAINWWLDGKGLWFVPMQRHDGMWVVIGGLDNQTRVVGCALPTEAEANAAIGRLWAAIRDVAERVLIEPPPSPI